MLSASCIPALAAYPGHAVVLPPGCALDANNRLQTSGSTRAAHAQRPQLVPTSHAPARSTTMTRMCLTATRARCAAFVLHGCVWNLLCDVVPRRCGSMHGALVQDVCSALLLGLHPRAPDGESSSASMSPATFCPCNLFALQPSAPATILPLHRWCPVSPPTDRWWFASRTWTRAAPRACARTRWGPLPGGCVGVGMACAVCELGLLLLAWPDCVAAAMPSPLIWLPCKLNASLPTGRAWSCPSWSWSTPNMHVA